MSIVDKAKATLTQAITIYEANRCCRLSMTVKLALVKAMDDPTAAELFLATGKVAIPWLTMQFNLNEVIGFGFQ